MGKKATDMGLNVIIIAAIALIVLVVLVMIFTGRMSLFNTKLPVGLTCDEKCEIQYSNTKLALKCCTLMYFSYENGVSYVHRIYRTAEIPITRYDEEINKYQ